MFAPSYIAAAALLITEMAKLGGFVGDVDQVSGAIVLVLQVVSALVVAYRQIVGGRSTVFGTRPRSFRGK
jgi:hypothetical protein